MSSGHHTFTKPQQELFTSCANRTWDLLRGQMSTQAHLMPASQINLNWTKICYEFWALEDKGSLFVRSKILVHKQANAWSLSTALSSHSYPLLLFPVLCSSAGSNQGDLVPSYLYPLPPAPDDSRQCGPWTLGPWGPCIESVSSKLYL